MEIVQAAENRLTEFFHVLGSPILQSEWDTIRKALVEARKTPTNNARDEICSYCNGNDKRNVAHIDLLSFRYCPYCGRKLSPVA